MIESSSQTTCCFVLLRPGLPFNLEGGFCSSTAVESGETSEYSTAVVSARVTCALHSPAGSTWPACGGVGERGLVQVWNHLAGTSSATWGSWEEAKARQGQTGRSQCTLATGAV